MGSRSFPGSSQSPFPVFLSFLVVFRVRLARVGADHLVFPPYTIPSTFIHFISLSAPHLDIYNDFLHSLLLVSHIPIPNLTLDPNPCPCSKHYRPLRTAHPNHHQTKNRSLKLSNTLQASLLKLSAKGISVFSPHTSLDSIEGGINSW